MVVKFFAPLFAAGFAAEVAALKFLAPVATLSPRLIEAGSIDGWNYVLMTQLRGCSLKQSWPGLSAQEQRLACFNVGSALRTIHALPVDGQKVTASGWSDFLGVQLRGCVERQERLGLDAAIVRQIDSFLARVDLHERDRQVFLHTEVMRDHVFFERSARSLAFSGFIDFEPSMIGCAEYDFAAVGIFLSCGDAHALRAFFAGYGSLPAVNSREFRRRIMAYTLLHKYSNLCWYLEFMPRASSLDELADLWWAV